jgi:hypothetical protein
MASSSTRATISRSSSSASAAVSGRLGCRSRCMRRRAPTWRATHRRLRLGARADPISRGKYGPVALSTLDEARLTRARAALRRVRNETHSEAARRRNERATDPPPPSRAQSHPISRRADLEAGSVAPGDASPRRVGDVPRLVLRRGRYTLLEHVSVVLCLLDAFLDRVRAAASSRAKASTGKARSRDRHTPVTMSAIAHAGRARRRASSGNDASSPTAMRPRPPAAPINAVPRAASLARSTIAQRPRRSLTRVVATEVRLER